MIAVFFNLALERLASTFARALLAGDVEEDSLGRVREGLPPLEHGEQAHCEKGAEDPDDANNHPAGKELLAENVATAIHGHGPEDQKGQPRVLTSVKQNKRNRIRYLGQGTGLTSTQPSLSC